MILLSGKTGMTGLTLETGIICHTRQGLSLPSLPHWVEVTCRAFTDGFGFKADTHVVMFKTSETDLQG